ncbi:MAG: DUF4136 domain-containing protein [bacterium]|nr:DUF4136 domain-containing protein [bacterium]
MIRRIALTLVVATLISPVLAKMSVDHDESADFTKYKTYAWREGTHAGDLMHKRIVEAIESRLEASGLRKVDAEPDVFVLYHAAVDNEQRVDIDDYGYWGRRPWGWGGTSSVNVYDVAVGTMLVDILDADQEELVWRGSFSREFSPNTNAQKAEKIINKKLEKMFRKFPPQP